MVSIMENKVDLRDVWKDVQRGIRKLWWLVLGLALGFALVSYFTVSSGYVPEYIASATVAVQKLEDAGSYMNQEAAEQMEEVFPYLMKNGVLKSAILADLGVDVMPGSLSMKMENGTNFFTISASANDPENAYALLQAALRQYPEVVKFIVGRVNVEVLDETGVPKDTGRAYVIRGSLKEGAVKGAFLGLFIMALYIVTRNTVKQRKELRKILNLEDYGSIPRVRAKKRKKKSTNRIVALGQHRVPQFYMEAMRKLRIKVIRAMEEREYRSLMITSSVPEEGKTTIAVNLAIALANQGKSVLLVDCDLRNPSVAEVMNEEKEHPGIGAVLHKKVSLEQAVTTVEVEKGKLQVLFGGEADKNAAQLLGTRRMENLLHDLEQMADIVILDTAPSGVLADAAVLAKFVDAALYVVRCDHAKKGRIRNGVGALSESDVDILGYVFNGDTSVGGGYGYGYGYGYKNYGRYYGYTGYGMRKKDDLSGRVLKD